MKKALAWLLVITMTAALAVGGTLAYLTDTDDDVNVMTVGKVKIDQLEYERVDPETKDDDAVVQEFHNNKPLLPAVIDKDKFDWETGENYVDWEQIGKDGYTSGIWNPEKINNEVDKMVFVENKGDFDAYVRTVIAFEAGNYTTLDEFNAKMHLNLNETDWDWEWTQTPVKIGEGNYFIATATYNKVLAPGALTEISLSQIALDPSATNEDVAAFGETYNVLVQSQAVQADGFDDPSKALNEAFGEISDVAIPWTSDQPPKGIDVRSALRFYQGDVNQPIHTEVTNVVFGLSKDYPAIANNNTGTLVTEEQDTQVHSYYVKEDGKYTVYFLSNGQVYLPKDSSSLFMEMTALTGVDTSNLNTGRTEKMDLMFHKCTALTDLDVSGFDTSKATNMYGMFYECSSLPGVDVSKWNTSNVTDMSYMFRACTSITELDVTAFDVSKVENVAYMFSYNDKLQKVNTDGWDTGAVTSTRAMFMNCYALEEIVGSGDWYLPNNTSMYYMFQRCYALETLDASDWDCSNVTTMQGTFFQCTGLKSVTGLGNWDTSKVTTMYGLFNNDYSLTSLEGIGNWDTGNVELMSFLFWNCCSLPEVDVGSWDTSKVTAFNSMFSGGGHNTGEMLFTHLPVENWDVSNATNMECMFYGCGQLTEMDLSKWRPGKVTNFRHTFADCFKLQHIDMTGWTTESATSFDGLFNDCYSLVELDLSDLDTGNCTTFAQFFEGCGGLKTVKGMENWDVSKVVTMSEMFNANGKDMHLEYVDLSSFNTLSLKDVESMFNGCYRLKTVYVGDGWDLSKVTDFANVFAGCDNLVGGAGTTFMGTNLKYAHVDGGTENPGYLTHINDKPVNP